MHRHRAAFVVILVALAGAAADPALDAQWLDYLEHPPSLAVSTASNLTALAADIAASLSAAPALGEVDIVVSGKCLALRD